VLRDYLTPAETAQQRERQHTTAALALNPLNCGFCGRSKPNPEKDMKHVYELVAFLFTSALMIFIGLLVVSAWT